MITVAWGAAVGAWLTWARAQGSPVTTLNTRRQHLEHLARRIGVADPWLVSGADLVAFVGSQEHWATETRRSRRTTFRAFYAWGVQQGHLEVSPALALPVVKPSRPNPRPAPDSVYLPTLALADDRERLMLRLAAEHGLRRAEISVVHRRDLVEDLAGWSLIVHGKGGRERPVPLLDDVALILRSLPDGYAFPGDDQGHLSPRWVGTLLNRLLPGTWTMHKLRHRAATKWWEASAHDLFQVQELLGHASPVTTRAYVAVTADRLRATVKAAAA